MTFLRAVDRAAVTGHAFLVRKPFAFWQRAWGCHQA